MKIAIVASEAAPFARTGGLGDVIGALPTALSRLGHEVRVLLPRYGSIDGDRHKLGRLDVTSEVEVNGRLQPLTIDRVKIGRSSLEYWFLENELYFGRDELYINPATGKEFEDNDDRFLFFNRAAMEALEKTGFIPDVIHVHDWQAGLIPAYLKTICADEPVWSNTRTVLTIHNLAYQGVFEADKYAKLGFPQELFYAAGPFEFYGKVNFLKAAIHYADKVSTVSEKYAQEIQTNSELGCGLEGVLRYRSNDLTGILNGVDYSIWSPSRDTAIPFNYHRANLGGKRDCKVELLNAASLPIRDRTPLIGMITRLADQKGLDLLAEVADDLFARKLQMIVLGNGDEKYHHLLAELEEKYPDKLKIFLKFDDSLAHQIEAGSDMFLMPSRFEPCGLNQMYSLKYGTIPVVREVGGLADTVVDYDEETGAGTGFVFSEYSGKAMIATLARALRLFDRQRLWIKLAKAGMGQDFSWDRSARKYVELFENATTSAADSR